MKQFFVEWWGLIALGVFGGGFLFLALLLGMQEDKARKACQRKCGIVLSRIIKADCYCRSQEGWIEQITNEDGQQ